jgi:transcriptional regulator with XRE-family HTH domain
LVGVSPEKLGVLAGMSHGVVRMIETGARQDPASPTLRKLARVLGVSVDWLMTGNGVQPTEESVRAAISAVAPGLADADSEPAPASERTPVAGKGVAS